jgi:hypothetical protein
MLLLGLPVLGVIVLLLVFAAVSDRRDRRRRGGINDSRRILRPIRETRRDVRAYRALSRGTRGPATDWMHHRRR